MRACGLLQQDPSQLHRIPISSFFVHGWLSTVLQKGLAWRKINAEIIDSGSRKVEKT
jgi:hypothetical protein